ncbi:aromatic ring-hydroxylating dioxygenase subunit alpha [Acidocella sp.]|uniref:aromatic ring-hydroxylating oxygenase subunit alpha n=1 Tax=Acidocella sp. TaxID=50710 RepID=UPI002605706E|nr:aromatic ring-hydroxylating dioxygenase subunit alpha [Acidocella sp.]MDD2795405.1 aromatic ring-hydroxylating dioxygenase subunit alpha [Acidocella sp.]
MDTIGSLREGKFGDDFGALLQDRGGLRCLDRRVFIDPELYEKEFKAIWEKVWVFVGHESQLPSPRSFFTAWVGRIPVIVSRNKSGEFNVFANICPHRGATLCRERKGVKANFVCSFHGWAFNDNGQLISPMNENDGGYPDEFDKESLGLRRLKFGNYRGFLFASLNNDVEPIEDYLAESKAFIDIIVDQSPQGIEVLKGSSTYTYNGNWKLQAENGVDGYHVAAVHANYVETTRHRAASKATGEKTKTLNVGDFPNSRGGYYDLGNGHTILWSESTNPQDRPLYQMREELAQRMGKVAAKWAVTMSRNLLIYPNVFLMDQMSTQIRIFRPLAVDKTEVTIYCFAPKGEPLTARAHRIRQYEDFFNASGMATPDDLAEFNATQVGYAAHSAMPWSDMCRGAAHEISGGDEFARELGISPRSSGTKIEDEGIFVAQHKRWLELMQTGAL